MATHEVMVTGRFARWMRRRRWTAVTLPLPFFGPVILYWLNVGESGPLWFVRIHELAHAEQIRRYGPFGFIARYLWAMRKGYRGNALENEAREAVDRAVIK